MDRDGQPLPIAQSVRSEAPHTHAFSEGRRVHTGASNRMKPAARPNQTSGGRTLRVSPPKLFETRRRLFSGTDSTAGAEELS